MTEEGPRQDALAELAEALAGPGVVEQELAHDALDELRRAGRISYMRARERRLTRERAVAATHQWE